MAFDVQAGRDFHLGSSAFVVALCGSSINEVQACWAALAEGATVLQ